LLEAASIPPAPVTAATAETAVVEPAGLPPGGPQPLLVVAAADAVVGVEGGLNRSASPSFGIGEVLNVKGGGVVSAAEAEGKKGGNKTKGGG
jgi:hypothetical protein